MSGPTLRLRQSATTDGRHRVELTVAGPGAPVSAVSQVAYTMSDEDRERLRWYLEDYLEYPLEPAPTIAAEVEARLRQLGTELFRALFAGDDARDLWARLRDQVKDLRVEITSDVADAAALPWELLRDPRTDHPLALQAASFVRTHHNPASPTVLPDPQSDARLRVLLVICRPAGGADVPFRSVAGRIVGVESELLDVDVLRPPTFARLTAVLESAAAAGRPYHVVHFDGHGTYTAAAQGGGGFGPLKYDQPGGRGYLLFEDAAGAENRQLVGGPELGALLARTGVPVLVLNACRSAYAEAPTQPQTGDAGTDAGADVHGRIRAYGSLALEVADAGVPGVVAMRYSVYVVTAAQFVADLYTHLLAGRTLGDAVASARRQLAAQPLRSIAFEPRPLQDWSVPVVYEAVPLRLFTRAEQPVRITIAAPDATTGRDAAGLPRPDVGFFGRDETLLALDRAFDAHRVVLLHGLAGAGKTSTAAEFARWYRATGGLAAGDVAGPVLWSSLEQHTPLGVLLNQLADVFAPLLAANDIPWQALESGTRRDVALQVLAAVPVLWVWDNVEPVAGFPAGTTSAWTQAEQDELRRFLADVGSTRARVLLTSRRDESGWLGQLPVRVVLPRMPMRERVQLTQALAAKAGHRIGEVQDWRPLLRYTDGNPLTIAVLVGQVLRERLTSKAQIEGFIDRLRAGETGIVDDEAQGRSASLAASLGYGFAHAFTDAERARLAVLHLFQETVDVDALVFMGHRDNPDQVPQLAGLDRPAGVGLLDRAAEIGLLTASGYGYYRIHPALPWFFTSLFATSFGPADGDDAARVGHAYTRALAALGNEYCKLYVDGRHQIVATLAVEEANLLHARMLARRHQRWADVIGCMQGVRMLYEHLGRTAQWARLVDELVPDLTDPTGAARPGREDHWSLLTEYRVRLALGRRDHTTAHQLQTLLVAWDRHRAAVALTLTPEQLSDRQRHGFRSLAASLDTLGSILRDQHDPDCLPAYHEAADLCQRINARTEQGIAAHNIATAYLEIPALRDLDQAQHWYQTSLDLTQDHDDLGRAKAISRLGNVALERFVDARAAGQPDDVLLPHLNTAADHYHQALQLTPADQPTDRGIFHNQLGSVYRYAGLLDTALHHYQQAITLAEQTGDTYRAGSRRHNNALTLADAGRISDALHYAHAALRDLQTLNPSPTNDIATTRQLINHLEGQLDP